MSEPAFALSVVVPVYNGAASVPTLVAALAALEVPGGLEIVLVNDASPDDSLTVCRDLCRRTNVPITVVDLSRNFGEHNAVMAGFRHARGAHVITMDDDLQNPPGEVLKLLAFAQAGGFDVVYTRYARKEHALWRNLGSAFANWCADHLLDKPKGLYLSSFRCVNAFTVRQVVAHAGPSPYVDGLIMQVTQRIGSLEVAHLPRPGGRSNYTLRRLVRLYLSVLFDFSITPLRVSTIAGTCMAALGVVGIVWVLVDVLLMGESQRGWASLMAGILLLSGVQLVMLGVIGEYVGRLLLTLNGKPQVIVRDVERNALAAARGAPDR